MDSSVLVKWLFCFLLFCNLVIPVIAVTRYSLSLGRVEVNHILLFTMGYILYWILPIIAGVLNYISLYRGLGDIWYSNFYGIPDEKLIIYLFCCLVFYISFISGGIMIQEIERKNNHFVSGKNYSYNKRLLVIFGIVLVFYLGYPFSGVLYYVMVFGGLGDILYSNFHGMPDEKLIIYLFCCLVFYISFISESIMTQKNEKEMIHHASEKKYSYNKKFLVIFLIMGIVFAVFLGYPLRHFFFSGYMINPKIDANGPFTAAIIFLLSMTIIYATKIHEDSKDSAGFWKIMANPYLFAYAIGAIILVSIGGRIILMSSVLMFLVFYSNYFRRISLIYLILTLCIMVLFSHVIVLWRTGAINEIFIADRSKLYVYLFSEPVAVSLSLVHFLKEYAIPVIKFPVVLLSNFINLIPTFLFPDKAMYIITHQDLGFEIFSPMGGINSIPSLMINFGVVGTAVFLFLFSAYLGWLKKSRRSVKRAIYILVSGWLPFCFFRSFEMTTIKMILEFSILEPLVVTFLCFLMTKRITHEKEIT